MSQLKMMLTVCFGAALVALVSAQGSFNPMNCGSGAQKQLSKYTSELNKATQSLMTSLTQQGSSALDMEGFSKDVNSIMTQFQELSSTQEFDAQKTVSRMTDLFRSQMSLMRYFANPQVGMGVMRSYLSYTNQLMSINTQLAMDMASECAPSRRSS